MSSDGHQVLSKARTWAWPRDSTAPLIAFVLYCEHKLSRTCIKFGRHVGLLTFLNRKSAILDCVCVYMYHNFKPPPRGFNTCTHNTYGLRTVLILNCKHIFDISNSMAKARRTIYTSCHTNRLNFILHHLMWLKLYTYVHRWSVITCKLH